MNHRHAVAFLRQARDLHESDDRRETYIGAAFALAALSVLYLQFGKPAKALYRGLREV